MKNVDSMFFLLEKSEYEFKNNKKCTKTYKSILIIDGIVRIHVMLESSNEFDVMIFVSQEYKKEVKYGNTIFRNCGRRRLAGSFL